MSWMTTPVQNLIMIRLRDFAPEMQSCLPNVYSVTYHAGGNPTLAMCLQSTQSL